MLTTISSSLSVIKSSLELIGVINDAKNEADREQAVSELQRQLTSLTIENLQLAQFLASQHDEILSLQRELRDAKENNHNLSAYTMHKTEFGHFIYKPDDENANSHYACPHCYHQGQIAILQPRPVFEQDEFHRLHCLRCENQFLMNKNPDYVPPLPLEELARKLSGNL